MHLLKMKEALKNLKFKVYKQKILVIKTMKIDLKNWCLGTLLFSTVWNLELFSQMKTDRELLKII